jgi:hypothetical protein
MDGYGCFAGKIGFISIFYDRHTETDTLLDEFPAAVQKDQTLVQGRGFEVVWSAVWVKPNRKYIG